MKVLYIGGTGEISYECVKRSVEIGHEVTVLNRARRVEELPRGARQVTGDLSAAEPYAGLAGERFDVVCQFLAYTLQTVQRDAEFFAGRCGQYVFISSASAYCKPPQSYIVTEATPLVNPYWPYSATKAAMEQWLLAQHAAGRLPVTVVRPSHTYRTRFPGGIADGDDWAWRILQGRPVIIHGDGSSLWTITHSRDFAAAFCNLLGKPAALGEAFHITQHMHAYAWNEIMQEVGRSLGREVDLAHVPSDTMVQYDPEWSGPLLGDKTWSVMFDNSKVMSVAGAFECKVSLAEGLAGSAEHYRRCRAPHYKPDEKLHALLDRIAADQRKLGSRE